MPSDSNGNYSLPGGYLAELGETIQPSQHNPPLEDLAAGHSARLMRSGVSPMTGPLKHSDGTEGAPAVTFNTNVATGLYKTANGLGVSVAGVKVAEFTAGGLSEGGRYIGELIPFTGQTAQPLTVLPYGQTLSRTTFSKLWAFAQTQIAAGNLFYNNGNGVDTFGIGDMRGRVFAGLNNMGGVSSGRLGSGAGFSSFGGADPNKIGAAAGSEIHQLITGQLPVHTPTGVVFTTTQVTAGVSTQTNGGGSGFRCLTPVGEGNQGNSTSAALAVSSSSFTGDAIGSNQSHNNVQPTLVGPWLLFAGQ